MDRRTILAALGLPVLGPLAGAAQSSGNSKCPAPRICCLERFYFQERRLTPEFDEYVAKTRSSTFWLEAILAPQTPQWMAIRTLASLDGLLDSGHPNSYRIAPATSEAQILISFRESLSSVRGHSGILELRSYHDPTPGSHRLSALFGQHGIRPVLYASTLPVQDTSASTYLIPFENFAAREKAWTSMTADPAWSDVQDRGGLAVDEIALYRVI